MADLKRLIIAVLVSALAHVAMLSSAWRPWISASSNGALAKQTLLVRIKAVSPSPVSNEPAASYSDRSDPKRNTHSQIQDLAAADALTEQPSLVGELPEIASFPTPEGKGVREVSLRLVIGAEGKAVYLQVLKSSVPKGVEEQVVQAFYQANYRPGRIGARAVTAEMLVSVSIE